MNYAEKQDYLLAIKKRYRRSSRQKKAQILEEFSQVCGYHRKYAIYLLNRTPKRHRKPTKRKVTVRYLLSEPHYTSCSRLSLIMGTIWHDSINRFLERER